MTPFSSADLAEIRQLLESLADQARQAEECARCDATKSVATAAERRARGAALVECIGGEQVARIVYVSAIDRGDPGRVQGGQINC